MSSGATLARAQRVFCVLFGWPPGRPHAFAAGDSHYQSDGDEVLVDVRLRHLLTDVGSRLEFEYGDESFHVMVEVERILPPMDAMQAPRCLGGEGEAPPLGGGGVWAWRESREHDDATAPHVGLSVDAINAELEVLP